MKKIKYQRSDRFAKQIKKLLNQYTSLEEDLLEAQKAAIELFHFRKIDSQSIELVKKFDHQTMQIYQINKFACKSLKDRGVNSDIKIIYAFDREKFTVNYLAIYFKEPIDYEFIKKYLTTI